MKRRIRNRSSRIRNLPISVGLRKNLQKKVKFRPKYHKPQPGHTAALKKIGR